MQPIVFASAIIKARSDHPPREPRERELLYSAPRRGLWEVVSVAAALGGVALYAAVLVLVVR